MIYSNNYSKEEQKVLAKQKVEKALAKISTDVISVFDNNLFPEYLKFASKFHYFDVNNVLLVYEQRPSATFLASFKAWEKYNLDNWGDINRPVFTSSQKGKGVGILAPYILKKKTPETDEQKSKVVSYFDYHVVFVFDKAQTNDIPVPIISWDLSKNQSDCDALYNAFRDKAPFDIGFSTEGINYKYSYEKPTAMQKKGTLILNFKDKNNTYLLCSYIIKAFTVHSLKDIQKKYNEDDFQKICECVSFMLSNYFGLPTEQYSFFFIKYWGGNNPSKMMGILNVIQTSAHSLIDLLEEEMIFYKSMYETPDSFDNNDIFEFNSFFDF